MNTPAPVRAIVPITVHTAFTPEEAALLNLLRIGEEKMFEYILATWGVFVDFFRMGRRDYAYDQLMSDLADDLFIDQEHPQSMRAQQLFAARADALFSLLERLHHRLDPMIGTLADGVPGQPVEWITYNHWTKQASVLDFHLHSPDSITPEEQFALRLQKGQAPFTGYDAA